MADQIVVISSAHHGYRRGGVRLVKGENVFPAAKFSDEQIKQLQADSLLYCAYQTDGITLEDVKGATQLQTKTDQSSDTTRPVGGGALPDPVTTLEQAFALLQPDNPDHFTKNNQPQLDALERLLGRKVTGAERNDAWAAYQATLAAADTKNVE